MKPASTLNKKLILHFDVDQVIRLPSLLDKDYQVYELCAQWVWGRLERNSKDDPDRVTGWKLASNLLTESSPENDCINYQSYLSEYSNSSPEEKRQLIINLTKGPAAKAKPDIEKYLKSITLSKTLFEAIRDTEPSQTRLRANYLKDGKYQILPAFFKLILALKKAKREFALFIRNSKVQDNHNEILEELNLFFSGDHPLFNGKNGTPAVKMDGSKGVRNFVVEETHLGVCYKFEKEYFCTFGTLNVAEEKDEQMFKQSTYVDKQTEFKSFKSVKMCEGADEIYSLSKSLLAEGACIYEINPYHSIFIDPVDYLTHQIYFTSTHHPQIYTCLGELLLKNHHFQLSVNLYELLKDVDYFIKKIDNLEVNRSLQIEKNQKGVAHQEEEVQQNQKVKEKSEESDEAYLQKNLLSVLEGALRQVDLCRPSDPVGFIALYCLKNRERLE